MPYATYDVTDSTKDNNICEECEEDTRSVHISVISLFLSYPFLTSCTNLVTKLEKKFIALIYSFHTNHDLNKL